LYHIKKQPAKATENDGFWPLLAFLLASGFNTPPLCGGLEPTKNFVISGIKSA